MAISGPEAIRSLDNAVGEIRHEEAELASRLARSGELVAKLRENEAELFRRLADLRLAPEMREQIGSNITRAESQAREMVARHASDITAAEDELKALDKHIAGFARSRRDILDEIDEAQGKLRALNEKIGHIVAANPAYAEKQKSALKMAEIAQESLKKTEIAEADMTQKGKPYRQDPLFMYLWETGYGTRNYRANNLVRWLDGMVARLVRYDAARPNFAMLNEIPMRLREHAERQLEAANQAEAELDAMEAAAVDEAGGKPMREKLANAQARLEKLDAEMVQKEDERDEKAREFRHLAEGRDPSFSQAIELLANGLAGEDIKRLWAEARATATGEDDTIVKQIEDIRSRLAEEETEAADHKARLKILAQRRRELEDIEWEFKRARYDDPRSVFREDNLAGDLLGEFLKGAITAAVYWEQWKKSQSWKPGSSDWGGGIGLPRSGRSRGGFSWPQSGGGSSPWGGGSSGRSGGGFSRPRTGTRGTRKSGGFKTGGGF